MRLVTYQERLVDEIGIFRKLFGGKMKFCHDIPIENITRRKWIDREIGYFLAF